MAKFKSEIRELKSLKNWEKNPRSINEVDLERLKKQIKRLGLYKPLLITEDGIVLGGNMRLRALQALGEKQVWVSVVDAPDDDKKLEYALSDNDRAGQYVEEELAELLSKSTLDRDMFAVDLGEATAVNDVLAMYGPTGGEGLPGGDSEDRSEVIMVVPPESPQLKENIVFRAESKDQYDRLKEVLGEKPDVQLLVKLVEKNEAA